MELRYHNFLEGEDEMKNTIFTSESVTQGHPDKLCDAISDAILDAYLEKDPMSRVACETCTTDNFVLVMGEITSCANINIEKIVRKTIVDIGYNKSEIGLDGNTCQVDIRVHHQSSDIALGVNQSFEAKKGNYEDIGAGDQGMMFGYATNETPEYLPYGLVIAHKLTRRLDEVRKSKVLSYLRPDGKSQVSLEYDLQGKPKRIDTIIISAQHDEYISLKQLQQDIKEKVIDQVVDEKMIDSKTKIYINPTGRFVIGGPLGDSGLTGRKIIVDTYGGYARHGGGAFSGKDPTKVDRSGAYMARYIAKNIVAAHLADKCEVQIAYAIGVAKLVSIFIDTFGTGIIEDTVLCKIISITFDLRPASIIEQLDLRKPIYHLTSAYGHFGHQDLSWEKLDKVNLLLNEIKK